MKNFVFIVLVIGFVLFGCDNGDGTNDKIYTVTIGSLTNGSISANPTSGVEGTEITLTVTPNSGYKLKAGSLKYGAIVINEETKRFNLPAENVTITAEFEPFVQEKTIIGFWEAIESEEKYIKLELKEDNTGVLIGTSDDGHGGYSEVSMTITLFEIVNDKLIIIFEGISDPYECDFELSQDGNTLTIIGLMWNDDGEGNITPISIPFTRNDDK